jgi:cation transport ATPase
MSSLPLNEKSLANTSLVGEMRNSPEMKGPDLGAKQEQHEYELEWSELIRIVFVVLAAAAVWFRLWEPFPHISVIGITATLIGGYPIFKEAFENIVERKMTMELSMTIALLSALAIGEFFTALVITAFVLAAEVWKASQLGAAGGLSRICSTSFQELSRSGATVR